MDKCSTKNNCAVIIITCPVQTECGARVAESAVRSHGALQGRRADAHACTSLPYIAYRSRSPVNRQSPSVTASSIVVTSGRPGRMTCTSSSSSPPAMVEQSSRAGGTECGIDYRTRVRSSSSCLERVATLHQYDVHD